MIRLVKIISLLLICSISYSQTKCSISLGGNLAIGNANLAGISTQSSISTSEEKPNSWALSPSFSYVEILENGTNSVRQREFYTTGNYTRKIKDYKVLANVEFEKSFLKKINSRLSIGIGVGKKLIDRKIEVSISELALLESYIDEVNTDKNINTLRLSTRLKVETKTKIKFISITLFQPSFINNREIETKDNINLRSTNTIEIPITKKFSINLNSLINGSTYSSFINPSVKPYDLTSTIQLAYKNF